MFRWIWILLALLLVALAWAAKGGSAGATVVAASACALPASAFGEPRPDQPLQSPVPAGIAPFAHAGFMVTPLAAFALEGRVLSREDYRLDPESALSPTDLALGWGRMADPAVYRQLAISQSGRWYHYRWDERGPPLPPQEIVRSSANMHLVPGTPAVASALARVDADQVVRLRGLLVEARSPEGQVWRSSLTRSDSGQGACELVVVCEIEAR